MRRVRKASFTVVTDAGGNYTGVTASIKGWIERIDFQLQGLDATADTTLVVTGKSITVASKTNTQINDRYYPRTVPKDNALTAGPDLTERFFLFDETLTLTIVQGGNVKTGTVDVYYEACG